jgi:hypothetical protein
MPSSPYLMMKSLTIWLLVVLVDPSALEAVAEAAVFED